jgi:hypothetical protein
MDGEAIYFTANDSTCDASSSWFSTQLWHARGAKNTGQAKSVLDTAFVLIDALSLIDWSYEDSGAMNPVNLRKGLLSPTNEESLVSSNSI